MENNTPTVGYGTVSFLYNGKNKGILLKRTGYLKKALDSIFSVSDESITDSIIQTIYDIASLRKIPINIVESTILMPQYLDSDINTVLLICGRINVLNIADVPTSAR